MLISRMDWIRSSPTCVCATAFVIFARSWTGLKNLARYARNTVREPTVIVPARASPAPRQRTIAVHNETMMAMIGESSDFTRRALSAASAEARSLLAEPCLLDVLRAKGVARFGSTRSPV
jgi:hypothetical protein